MAKDIKLTLDVDSTKGTAQVKKTTTGLKRLGTVGAKAANKLSKGFVAAAAKMKLLAVGIAASTAAVGYMSKKVLDSADATAKLADSLGYNIKLMQEYAYAAGLSGVSQGTLNSSMLAFAKRLGEAKAGSGALVTYLKKTDTALLNQLTSATDVNEALKIFMNALGNVEDSTKRAALASAGFSRAGIAMTVMVKDGGGALRAMMKEANDLGLVMGEKLYRNAEKLNDSMSKVSQVIKIMFTKAVLTLAPYIDTLATSIVEWIKKNQELIDKKFHEGINKIKEAVKFLTDNVNLLIIAFKGFVGLAVASVFINITTTVYGACKAMYVFTAATIASTIATARAAKAYATTFAVASTLGANMDKVAAQTSRFGKVILWLMPLLTVFKGIMLATSLGIGYALGTWINKFDAVKATAQLTINDIAYAWSYSLLQIQLFYYKTLDKIKAGWVGLNNWFMKTLPKLAQYLGMKKLTIKPFDDIAKIESKVKKLKETYKELEGAIYNAYSAGDGDVVDGPYVQTDEMKERWAKYHADLEKMKDGAADRDEAREIERLAEIKRHTARVFKEKHPIWLAGYEEEEARLDEYANYRMGQEKSIASKIRAVKMQDKSFALADLAERFQNYKNFTTDLIGLELWRATEEKSILEAGKTNLQKWAESAKTWQEQMSDTAMAAAESFSSGFTDAFFEFAEGAKSAGEAFRSFAAGFLKQIAKMIMQQMIFNAIKSAFGGYFAAEGGTVSPKGGPPGRASGGPVASASPYIVGERGPEFFIPQTAGRILSNKDSQKALQGGNNINTTINVNTTPTDDPESAKREAREMARVIEMQFNKNLMKQMRVGGLLNSA